MGSPRKPRAFHPQSVCEDRDGAIAMLGGKPSVLDALVKRGLLEPVVNDHKLTLFDTGEILAAYGKAKQHPELFHRPARKPRRAP